MSIEKSATLRPRRVLIIVENLPVPFDRRVWHEAMTLKAAGYQVTIICPLGKGYDKRRETIEGIEIYRHSLPAEARGLLQYALEYGTALAWEWALAWRILFRHGFDVIQACNPPDLIFAVAGCFKLLFRTRFVFDHHDICPELFQVKFGRRRALHRLVGFFEHLTFRLADVSIATNESFKEIAVRRGGMDPDKVFVVRSAPDLARFRRRAPDSALRNGRRLVVGYVGIINAQDGVDYLLRAMHDIIICRGIDDLQCVIVGDGPDLPRLKALAGTLSLSEHVTFCGYLRGEELLSALSTFDVGVIPDPSNDYNDKISMNKCFEYMALGIPVVQFDLPESRRLVGDAGIYARPNEPAELATQILALAASAEARARMGRIGRERVRTEFSWSLSSRELLAAYEAALAPASSPVQRSRRVLKVDAPAAPGHWAMH